MTARITVRVPEDLLEPVEQMVERGEYANLSVAVREALKLLDTSPETSREGSQRVMTDGGVDREDGVEISPNGPELHPFVDPPEGYLLTEVVVEQDTPPEVVRQYLGIDPTGSENTTRMVALINGGAERREGRPVEFQLDEQRGITRVVVEDGDMAVNVLKTVLARGDYSEVDDDGE